MISFIKKNKTLSLLLILSIIVLLISLLLPSIMPKEEKNEIANNIIELQQKIQNKSLKVGDKKTIVISTFYILITWLLGISILGIPLLLIIYSLKELLLGTELIYFLININKTSILTVFFYLIPKLISLFVYFVLTYYAINYSIFLIRLIFNKNSYNNKKITIKYIKILIFCIIINLINLIIETYAIPNILNNFH